MLKRLRTKLVIVIMSIVGLLLASILIVLYVSTANSMEAETVQMMQAVSINPMQTARPDRPRDDMQLPYFSILQDKDGGTIEIGNSGSFDLSDEGMKESLIEMAESFGTETGVLKDYNLRFLKNETPMGVQLVFADITNEQATLSNMLKIFSLIAALAFLVLLGISILLARWVVKPVDKAWQQQRQFVSDASHELKTPLTVIMTDADILCSGSCSDTESSQLTNAISTMSRQMRGLVESLLDMARVDEGRGITDAGTVNFSDCISEGALLFEPVFFEKGMSFDYEIEPDIFVKGDSARLRHLAEIFLDNAAKYASPGGNTRLTLKKTRKKRCSLEVSNEGEPISKDDLENLFKRFYRADKVRSMNHSYGLGLSIAKATVEGLGGKIHADSKDGRNIFTVELPVGKLEK